MNEFCKKIIENLDEEITDLTRENGNSLVLYEKIIKLVLEQISKIKNLVKERGFINLDEEIQFFKGLKPNILSKLIYYNSIYKIEAKKPYIGEKIIESYLNDELCRLKKFFDNNLEFYKYYRTNSTYLDHKYFVRGKYDIKLSLDTFYFEADHSFSTSHDYKVAKIIANDLIQVYLEDQLHNTVYRDKSIDQSKLNWTGSKAAIIELIYALHAQRVFDNGNTDIKVIAKTFERTFNVDLGDFYHTYLELKNRKVNRTKFLDSLREGLIKKMDEQDEK
ncbi:RteC domain-containing protein [Elizabethkingia miricola]|uniref:RteC domain-containing protein n=1 Tax=Elizabethkingia miricola TaxID=172045 RepID=UPI003891D544